MHAHWQHLSWALLLGWCSAFLPILAATRQVHQIIGSALKLYRRLREQPGLRNSPRTRAILPAGAEKCKCHGCASKEFDKFIVATSEMVILAALSIMGADTGKPPSAKVWDLVQAAYGETHRVWQVVYERLDEADRLADLLKLLFTASFRRTVVPRSFWGFESRFVAGVAM